LASERASAIVCSARGIAFASLLLACEHAVAPRVASAQPVGEAEKTAARKLAQEALSLYDAGKYAPALEMFDRIDAVVHAPTMGLMAARCLEKLGRLVAAADRYLAVTRAVVPPGAAAVQRTAQVDAAREREALLPRIPTLQIDVSGSGVTVKLDDRRVPEARLGTKTPVDPGHHRVEARRGDEVVTKEIDVAEGASTTVLLDPQPSAPAAPAAPVSSPSGGSGQRYAGGAVLGVGGAGIVLGAVTGALVLVKLHDLEAKGCADGTCPPAVADELTGYRTLRTLSTAGFVGGLVCAGAGITLILTAPRSPAPAARTWSPWIGPGLAGARGTF
jgi:hypothetical protein